MLKCAVVPAVCVRDADTWGACMVQNAKCDGGLTGQSEEMGPRRRRLDATHVFMPETQESGGRRGRRRDLGDLMI